MDSIEMLQTQEGELRFIVDFYQNYLVGLITTCYILSAQLSSLSEKFTSTSQSSSPSSSKDSTLSAATPDCDKNTVNLTTDKNKWFKWGFGRQKVKIQ